MRDTLAGLSGPLDSGLFGRRRMASRGAAITGTAPALAPLVAGDLLESSVEWGVYASSAGTIASVLRQMREGSGPWVPFDGETTVVGGESWAVREVVTDSAGNARTFASPQRIVPAEPGGEVVWIVVTGPGAGQVSFLDAPPPPALIGATGPGVGQVTYEVA
ncbi:MAG: hypothetical protein ACK4OP_00135 [Gemmobacter sp.]